MPVVRAPSTASRPGAKDVVVRLPEWMEEPRYAEHCARLLAALALHSGIAANVVYKINTYPVLGKWLLSVSHDNEALRDALWALSDWGTRTLGFMANVNVATILLQLFRHIEDKMYPVGQPVAWRESFAGQRVLAMIRVARSVEDRGNQFALGPKLTFLHLCKMMSCISPIPLRDPEGDEKIHAHDQIAMALLGPFVDLFKDGNCAHYATDATMRSDASTVGELVGLARLVEKLEREGTWLR